MLASSMNFDLYLYLLHRGTSDIYIHICCIIDLSPGACALSWLAPTTLVLAIAIRGQVTSEDPPYGPGAMLCDPILSCSYLQYKARAPLMQLRLCQHCVSESILYCCTVVSPCVHLHLHLRQACVCVHVNFPIGTYIQRFKTQTQCKYIKGYEALVIVNAMRGHVSGRDPQYDLFHVAGPSG